MQRQCQRREIQSHRVDIRSNLIKGKQNICKSSSGKVQLLQYNNRSVTLERAKGVGGRGSVTGSWAIQKPNQIAAQNKKGCASCGASSFFNLQSKPQVVGLDLRLSDFAVAGA